MEVSSDLVVDVNGQHVFWVSKKILATFSSKLSDLFVKHGENGINKMKVIFQYFPGGANAFEDIARFCYKNGIIEITHSNVVILNQVAKFMEMHKSILGSPNLLPQTEKFLEGIEFWTWSELLLAIKHGQKLLDGSDNSVSSMQTLLDELVGRLSSRSLATPSYISSQCSSFRSSCDSKSTQTTKTNNFIRFWWFEELLELDIVTIEILVRKMVKEKFDHSIISKLLFYYQRKTIFRDSKFTRVMIIQRVISLVSLLDKRSISIKGLFDTLRLGSSVTLRKSSKVQLEFLIGLQLDQASLDDLLLPTTPNNGKSYTKYNVSIVVRFLKNFLLEGNVSYKVCSYRLKRVARLVDLYAREIAPDVRLKASKFVDLAMLIADSARDSYDKIYQAVEIYLEVHPRLGEEQKMKVCSILNYEKLSPQVLNHLSRNTSFPLTSIVKALIYQNPKLKGAKSIRDARNLRSFASFGRQTKEIKHKEQIVLVKELSRNEKLKLHLQKMGWSEFEIENIFGKMQTQNVANVKTPHVCCVSNVKHLPKLCS